MGRPPLHQCMRCGLRGHSRAECPNRPFQYPLLREVEDRDIHDYRIIATHPTLLDIANRESQILDWEIRKARFDKRKPIGSGAIYLSGAISLCGAVASVTVGPSLAYLTWFMAFLILVFGLTYRGFPPGPRPSKIPLGRYADWENSKLARNQEKERFWAQCACPGCGEVTTHLLLDEDPDWLPDWATVTRECESCGRQWAQY